MFGQFMVPQLIFFEIDLMNSDQRSQYIKVRKLFKGGNYSRAETISGNTILVLNKNYFRKYDISAEQIIMNGKLNLSKL